ncbi:hypothetical protein HETIRDRAFT_453301 [Heterobasidion irregulare TC 32-1]|uniref:Uncharacterized protein n=1 Tax=Heterobasidion irregulare (strain TC 32-1) TaxID=747525 RepID=W4JYS3_HETIT|nr:uncharacterized protein HETIRDRAFT_453301 [Heterobasidion irregulare TC 32-1]ETW78698.1 hypothetical protein HETIRDRAFT_453301 [Heterobasidion irregulare TC 32-1]
MAKSHPEPTHFDDALVDLPTIEMQQTGAALEPPSDVNSRVGKIVESDVDVPVPLEYWQRTEYTAAKHSSAHMTGTCALSVRGTEDGRTASRPSTRRDTIGGYAARTTALVWALRPQRGADRNTWLANAPAQSGKRRTRARPAGFPRSNDAMRRD